MQYPRGLPWLVEVNAFTDMSKSEFRNNFLGYRKEITMSRKNERIESVFSNEITMADLPKQVDWREKSVSEFVEMIVLYTATHAYLDLI
jgi:hypothetical protein